MATSSTWLENRKEIYDKVTDDSTEDTLGLVNALISERLLKEKLQPENDYMKLMPRGTEYEFTTHYIPFEYLSYMSGQNLGEFKKLISFEEYEEFTDKPETMQNIDVIAAVQAVKGTADMYFELEEYQLHSSPHVRAINPSCPTFQARVRPRTYIRQYEKAMKTLMMSSKYRPTYVQRKFRDNVSQLQLVAALSQPRYVMVMLLCEGITNLKSVAARRVTQNVQTLWAWTAVSKQFYLYCDHRPLQQSVDQWCDLMPQILAAVSEYSKQDERLTAIQTNMESSQVPLSLMGLACCTALITESDKANHGQNDTGHHQPPIHRPKQHVPRPPPHVQRHHHHVQQPQNSTKHSKKPVKHPLAMDTRQMPQTTSVNNPQSSQSPLCDERIEEIMGENKNKQTTLRQTETGELLNDHLRKINRETVEEVVHHVVYNVGHWSDEAKNIMMLLDESRPYTDTVSTKLDGSIQTERRYSEYTLRLKAKGSHVKVSQRFEQKEVVFPEKVVILDNDN